MTSMQTTMGRTDAHGAAAGVAAALHGLAALRDASDRPLSELAERWVADLLRLGDADSDGPTAPMLEQVAAVGTALTGDRAIALAIVAQFRASGWSASNARVDRPPAARVVRPTDGIDAARLRERFGTDAVFTASVRAGPPDHETSRALRGLAAQVTEAAAGLAPDRPPNGTSLLGLIAARNSPWRACSSAIAT